MLACLFGSRGEREEKRGDGQPGPASRMSRRYSFMTISSAPFLPPQNPGSSLCATWEPNVMAAPYDTWCFFELQGRLTFNVRNKAPGTAPDDGFCPLTLSPTRNKTSSWIYMIIYRRLPSPLPLDSQDDNLTCITSCVWKYRHPWSWKCTTSSSSPPPLL